MMDKESVQVCRLCLAAEEDLIHLFNPKGYQGLLLWEIIEELLQMEVSKKDGLPWTICECCIGKVKEFKDFKMTCIKAKISYLTMIANRGLVMNVKDETDTDKSLSDAETCGKGDLFRDEFTCTGVSSGAALYDPLDLTGVKQDADANELLLEEVTCNQENVQHIESLDVAPLNVVCLSLAMGECPTEEEVIEPRESMAGEETHEGDNIVEEYLRLSSVNNVVSVPQAVGDMANVKEEVTSSESLSELENSSEEYPQKSESSNRSVSNVVSPQHEMEDLVYGCGRTEGSPKMGEEIVSDREEDREKNIIEKCKRNASLSGLPGEHSLIHIEKNRKKKGNSLKSSDNITSAFKFSGMMPSEKRHLDSHSKTFAGYTEFTCDYCKSTCTDKSKLAVHVRGHILNNKPSKSAMRGDLYRLCLESRITGFQISKTFECKTCGKNFKSKKELKGHLVVHGNLKPFICESCGKEFKHRSTLVIHSVIHSGLRPFICDTCGKGFTQKSHLVTHSVIHTGLRPYKCDTCGKGFSRKGHLVAHSVTHTGLRPYKCDTCGKGFTCKPSLVTHSVIHTGLRPYKCDTCGKGFTCKSSLVTHSVIHTGLRPFKCDTCGKVFKQKSYLVQHSAIHTGLRRYKCKTCGKGFTQKSHLVTHSVIHTGLRPYKCDTCGKKFSLKSYLVTHSVMHTSLRPYKCKTCGKDFKYSSGLTKHSMIHS